MFNSPILDTCISIIFIFLLYSLLATSVSESIASLFALRARMLRKGIMKGMLSNGDHERFSFKARSLAEIQHLKANFKHDSERNTWLSPLKAVGNFFRAVYRMLAGKPYPYQPGTVAGDFYLHPIIRNHGSSRRYSIPSYISRDNFSAVLLDTLEGYFETYKKKIIEYFPAAVITADLARIEKISLLVSYLSDKRNEPTEAGFPQVDPDTLDILKLYLKDSAADAVVFEAKVENWFDTTMDRVSGWYKRQGQVILFFLGMGIALTFNVDIIEITEKLGRDPDTSAKLADVAVRASQQAQDSITKAQYLQRADSLTRGDIVEVNDLLAIGWGDFGFSKDSADYPKRYRESYVRFVSESKAEAVKAGVPNANISKAAFDKLYQSKEKIIKVRHVLSEIDFKKFCGFIVFAFGICLGAPFWFDLLQKVGKLRAAGKKESGSGPTGTASVEVRIVNDTNNPVNER